MANTINNSTYTTAKKTINNISKGFLPFSKEDVKNYFAQGQVSNEIIARLQGTPVTKIFLTNKGTVSLDPKVTTTKKTAKEKIDEVTPEVVDDSPVDVEYTEVKGTPTAVNSALKVNSKQSQFQLPNPNNQIAVQESIISDQQVINILESLDIELPSFMRLTEALINLNSLFTVEIAKYLDEKAFNTKIIYKDTSSGRLIAEDGNGKKFFIDEIAKYIGNTVSQAWNTYDQITNEEMAVIKEQLTKFLKSYSFPLDNLIEDNNLKAKFTLGNILKMKESVIKKFKEAVDSNSIFDTIADWKVSQRNPKYKSSIEIEFNCCIFNNTENVTNSFATEEVISSIQEQLCNALNEKKISFNYDTDKKQVTYNVSFERGNEQSTRILKDKNVIIFTLNTSKVRVKEKQKKSHPVLNALATASGAVVQANKQGGSSTAGKLML